MKKPIFTWAEAARVAWQTSPQLLRLELFNWKKRKEIQTLKRGLYCFPDRVESKSQIAQVLFTPSYLSLEWALHHYELLPDVVFSLTLVSPRGSRTFMTPYGEFIYRRIHPDLFFGFDPATGMATPEKALLDYFYFNSRGLLPSTIFWREMRWQNLSLIKFKQVKDWVKKFHMKKMTNLLQSLEEYAKTNQTG
ncbi:MAG: hypothetical protein HYT97_03895 [Elusimicrobia bacterium]|nr:hypothetical protein [Elusimicrobiota bacterium]